MDCRKPTKVMHTSSSFWIHCSAVSSQTTNWRCNGLYGGWGEKALARKRNVGSRPRRSYFPQKAFTSKIPIFNLGSEVQLLSQLLCNFSRGLFLFCVSHCNFFTRRISLCMFYGLRMHWIGFALFILHASEICTRTWWIIPTKKNPVVNSRSLSLSLSL